MVTSGSRLKRSVRATLKRSSPGGSGASAARSMRRRSVGSPRVTAILEEKSVQQSSSGRIETS
jgi:hypothetical protein